MRTETIGPCTLILADCREAMAAMAADSVHACVTDPPYELGFMGKAWDKANGVASDPATWEAVRRVLTPGGHVTAFAGSRTYHRIAMGIERGGFDVRDMLMWLYGSGFPKSLDVAKDLDKRGGVWRGRSTRALPDDAKRAFGQHYEQNDKGSAVSSDAKRWEGWGTALKPAHEPICLARKPFRGTVADTVLAHGTGAINIDASRVGLDGGCAGAGAGAAIICFGGGLNGTFAKPVDGLGRWPANVLTDGSAEIVEAFPQSSRDAIRFFYSPKADKAEREFGMRDAPQTRRAGTSGDGIGNTPKVNGERPTARGNFHPTVKPVDLMAWLIRLVTPPDGVVLDPFMGSGSTGIAAVRHGFRFVGVEQSPEYFDIACRRIEAAVDAEAAMPRMDLIVTRAVRALAQDRNAGQMAMAL